jgi:hypothetical protein
MYPLPGMDINPFDASYTLLYEAFTSFNYPTEAWYYAALAGQPFPDVPISSVYYGMQAPGFFNPKVQQDIWNQCEGATLADWELPYCTTGTMNYFKYAFLNNGIGGLFTTSYDYLFDYLTDHPSYWLSYSYTIANTPVYLGGDPALVQNNAVP